MTTFFSSSQGPQEGYRSLLCIVSRNRHSLIKIFENRLSEQIKRNEIEAKKDNVDDFYGIHKVSDKKDNVNALDASIATAENERNIDPPEVQNLQSEKRQAEQRLEKKRAENNSLIQTHRQAIAQIENNRDNYRPTYDVDGNIVGESLTKEANDKISSSNMITTEYQLFTNYMVQI